MTNIADSKEEPSLQVWENLKTSSGKHIAVGIGLMAIVTWLLSQVPLKRRRTNLRGKDQGKNHYAREIRPASKSRQPKSRGGLLSLAVELLGAVAIRLLRRYLKSWSSTLVARLKNPPDPGLHSGGDRKSVV